MEIYRYLTALLIFLSALVIYWGSATYFHHLTTPDVAYFNHLAAAFLKGELYLAMPPSTHDLTLFEGQWYVPFPPLPALLMLPWIAFFDLVTLNTTLFCTIFGALNVLLLYQLLTALHENQLLRLSREARLWLTLLFGVGTVHWYMATIGSVWFVAQICTVTFVALAVWFTAANRPAWLCGSALALAILARPTVLLTWPLLLTIAAHGRSNSSNLSPNDSAPNDPGPKQSTLALIGRMLPWAIRSAVPMTVALLLLLLYNYARFANPFDFGYLTENVAAPLAPKLQTYGQFNLHYFPKNLWAMWLAGPQWSEERNFWYPNPEGMSLLLTTPALIYLARARHTLIAVGGWLSFLLLMIPLLFYYNTGWWQFGYRFSLDFMVPVMVLLAIATRGRTSWSMRLLILLGIVVNGYGVYWWHA